MRVRDSRLEPHQFRIFQDINRREWLVYIRYSLQIRPHVYAYEIMFTGKSRQGMRARFEGRIEATLPDGRLVFQHVQSLHGRHLDKYAWWALNKVRIPLLNREVTVNESPYVPHHVRLDANGLETAELAPFQADDYVTFVGLDSNVQAYVLARHDPVVPGAPSLYVILCREQFEYTVHTVHFKDLRPPEFKLVARPKPDECWWLRDRSYCLFDPVLGLQLKFCPPPRDGFQRGHLVSVPDHLVENNRLCACIENTWVMDGHTHYQVG